MHRVPAKDEKVQVWSFLQGQVDAEMAESDGQPRGLPSGQEGTVRVHNWLHEGKTDDQDKTNLVTHPLLIK